MPHAVDPILLVALEMTADSIATGTAVGPGVHIGALMGGGHSMVIPGVHTETHTETQIGGHPGEVSEAVGQALWVDQLVDAEVGVVTAPTWKADALNVGARNIGHDNVRRACKIGVLSVIHAELRDTYRDSVVVIVIII